MTPASTKAKHLRRSPLSLPDLGPWAGVLLLLCAVFMLAARFADQAPFLRLPTVKNYFPGCFLERNYNLIISIDAKSQIYIAVNDDLLQTTIIQQVAKRHNITFTTAQLQQLQKIPFLSQDIRRLPAWLSASRMEQQQFPRGIPASSIDDQLSEYIAASVSESPALYGKPIRVELRADETLRAAEVTHVMQLLRKQGINYINFITELAQHKS
ncbi:MAG TPA: biopolymer transporter ExbD [Hymenobacter sp.]|jgi:biopolymer transport protein ExbD